MKRAIKRIVIGLIVLQVGAFVSGLLLRRRFPSSGDETSDEIALVTIMNGTDLRSRAGAFRGGSALTLLGGTEIDLRDTTLAPGGAVLRTRTILGGLDVRVPPSCRVVVDGHALLGNVDDLTDGAAVPEDAPPLVIEASAVLSGVSVRR